MRTIGSLKLFKDSLRFLGLAESLMRKSFRLSAKSFEIGSVSAENRQFVRKKKFCEWKSKKSGHQLRH